MAESGEKEIDLSKYTQVRTCVHFPHTTYSPHMPKGGQDVMELRCREDRTALTNIENNGRQLLSVFSFLSPLSLYVGVYVGYICVYV